MQKKYPLVLVLMLFVCSSCLYAQDDSLSVDQQMYEITLKNGNVLKGKIFSKTALMWRVATFELGILEINTDQIVSIKAYDEKKIPLPPKDSLRRDTTTTKKEKGVVVFPTRYLFAPSAYNLQKGEGMYTNTWAIINGGYYGITKNWSIGAGFAFIPTATPYYFSTKISWRVNDNVQVAANFQLLGIWYARFWRANSGAIFLPQGLVTLGKSTGKNITLGLGGFASDKLQQNGLGTVLSLSAVFPFSRKSSFITQNHLWNIGGRFDLPVLSVAIRQRIQDSAFDYGVFMIPISNIVVPVFIFSYHVKL